MRSRAKEWKVMKKGIHPEYQKVVFMDTGSEYKFLSGSTRSSDETIEWEDVNTYPLFRVEISSDTHPLYTGKQREDRAGARIDRCNRKYNIKYILVINYLKTYFIACFFSG